MPENPTESIFTKRRRGLKQIAALVGAGVGLAASPQTRQAADALDSAAQAAAAEAAKTAKTAWYEQYEGKPALVLTKLDQKTGERLWQNIENTPPVKYNDSVVPDHGVERFYMREFTNKVGRGFILVEDGTERSKLFIYTDKTDILIFNNNEQQQDSSSFYSPGKSHFDALAKILFPTGKEGGVKLLLTAFRKSPTGQLVGLVTRTSQNINTEVVAFRNDQYYLVESTTTGLRNVQKNLGKPVEPIK